MGLTKPALLSIKGCERFSFEEVHMKGTAVVNVRLLVFDQHYGQNVECAQWCVRTKAMLFFQGT